MFLCPKVSTGAPDRFRPNDCSLEAAQENVDLYRHHWTSRANDQVSVIRGPLCVVHEVLMQHT